MENQKPSPSISSILPKSITESSRTDIDELVDDILKEEPLIPITRKQYLVDLIQSIALFIRT
jgi:hypothetical protein